MGATSQSVTYSTIAALALDKLSDKIADAISTVTLADSAPAAPDGV